MQRTPFLGITLAAGLMTASACDNRTEELPEASPDEPDAVAGEAEEAAEAQVPEPEVEPNGTIIEVQLERSDPEGENLEQFSPQIITAKVGDTVRFTAAEPSHQWSSIAEMLPEGARGWEGEIDEEVSYVLPRPGIYGFQCVPHYAAGTTGIVIVEGEGMTENLEAARAARHPGLAGRKVNELFEKARAEGLIVG